MVLPYASQADESNTSSWYGGKSTSVLKSIALDKIAVTTEWDQN